MNISSLSIQPIAGNQPPLQEEHHQQNNIIETFLSAVIEEGNSDKGCDPLTATESIFNFVTNVDWLSIINPSLRNEENMWQDAQKKTRCLLKTHLRGMHLMYDIYEGKKKQNIPNFATEISKNKPNLAMPIGWKPSPQKPGHLAFLLGSPDLCSLFVIDTLQLFSQETTRPVFSKYTYPTAEDALQAADIAFSMLLPTVDNLPDPLDLASSLDVYTALHDILRENSIGDNSTVFNNDNPLTYFHPKNYRGGCSFNFLKPLIYSVLDSLIDSTTDFSTRKRLKTTSRFIYLCYKLYCFDYHSNSTSESIHISHKMELSTKIEQFKVKHSDILIQDSYQDVIRQASSQ